MKDLLATSLAPSAWIPSVVEDTRRNEPGDGATILILPRDRVRRLDQDSGFRTMAVTHGLIWLTATPGEGDVLLQAGDWFELGSGWPYVIGALEAAEVLLLPTDLPYLAHERTSDRVQPRPDARVSTEVTTAIE